MTFIDRTLSIPQLIRSYNAAHGEEPKRAVTGRNLAEWATGVLGEHGFSKTEVYNMLEVLDHISTEGLDFASRCVKAGNGASLTSAVMLRAVRMRNPAAQLMFLQSVVDGPANEDGSAASG
jgi:hypothetical protein